MYLPTKLKTKLTLAIIIGGVLFFFAFRGLVESLVIFFLRQPLFSSQKFSKQISDLEKENVYLKMYLEGSVTLKKENQELREALDFKSKSKLTLVGAEVVGFSPSIWRRFAFLDIGSEEGLKSGDIGIDAEGNLMGIISEVSQGFSRFILVNDPNFNISVFVGKNNFGLLKGNLSNALIMYIENGDNVNIGDKVWLKSSSSNLSIEVGEIKKIIKDRNSLFCDIQVKLSSENKIINRIFIIK